MIYLSHICPDCGVGVGDRHAAGCDVERCSNCGGQRLSCGCAFHDPDLSVWIGTWPGEVTAIAKGWYSVFVDAGWLECGDDVPGAGPDLNRVSEYQQRRLQALKR